MEQKSGRGNRQRRQGRTGRKFPAFLSALWLVIVCLAGCSAALSGDDNTFAPQTFVMVEETGGAGITEGEGQQDGTQDSGGKEESSAAESSGKEEENGAAESFDGEEESDGPETGTVEESGSYTSKEDVGLYLHLYGHLPDNYITKKEAESLGWDSRAGNLWEVAPGMSIGGSRFGNYEGLLPDKKGRKYYECDIDYEGGYRGAGRIVYSDDGLIYYTEDHYKTFEQLYGQ